MHIRLTCGLTAGRFRRRSTRWRRARRARASTSASTCELCFRCCCPQCQSAVPVSHSFGCFYQAYNVRNRCHCRLFTFLIAQSFVSMLCAVRSLDTLAVTSAWMMQSCERTCCLSARNIGASLSKLTAEHVVCCVQMGACFCPLMLIRIAHLSATDVAGKHARHSQLHHTTSAAPHVVVLTLICTPRADMECSCSSPDGW